MTTLPAVGDDDGAASNERFGSPTRWSAQRTGTVQSPQFIRHAHAHVRRWFRYVPDRPGYDKERFR